MAEPAEKAHRQALQLYERLVAEHPQVPQYRQELAGTHNNLDVLLQITGRVAEAEKAFRQALQLREQLVAEHPQVPEYRQQRRKLNFQKGGIPWLSIPRCPNTASNWP
jgi:tetratricopeptide (TPR) repeat protein